MGYVGTRVIISMTAWSRITDETIDKIEALMRQGLEAAGATSGFFISEPEYVEPTPTMSGHYEMYGTAETPEE